MINWVRSHQLVLSIYAGACLATLVFLGFLAFYERVELGPSMPKPQVIGEKYNLCIYFEPNHGSGEFWIMVTHRCDVQVSIDEYDRFRPGTYLDAEATQECGNIEFLPPDSDGIMGILETPEQLCRTIAHPGAESRQITYKIDKDGKFIELSRK
jgi:hypothetical protein